MACHVHDYWCVGENALQGAGCRACGLRAIECEAIASIFDQTFFSRRSVLPAARQVQATLGRFDPL